MSEQSSPVIPLESIVPGCLNGKYAKLAQYTYGLLDYAALEKSRYGSEANPMLEDYQIGGLFRSAIFVMTSGNHTTDELHVFGTSRRAGIQLRIESGDDKVIAIAAITNHDELEMSEVHSESNVDDSDFRYGLQSQPSMLFGYLALCDQVNAFVERGGFILNKFKISSEA